MKWNATDAGPIQVSKFNKAWCKLGTAFCTYKSKTPGLLVMIFGIGQGEEADEANAKRAIGERYSYTLTRANAKDIMRDIETATKKRLDESPDEGARLP